MTQDLRARVLEFLEKFHADPDFDELGKYLAEDATYIAIVPDAPPVSGRDAVLETLKFQYQTYYDITCEIHTTAVEGPLVFTERTDHVTLHHEDRKIDVHACAIFEFDEDGRISIWREYWDMANVARQAGGSPDQMLEVSTK